MFSFFYKKRSVNHPLFGAIAYRPNRGGNKATLPGFWEGKLELVEESPTQLIIWGDKKNAPHPKQEALFNRLITNFKDYIDESKRGLLLHVQEEEGRGELIGILEQIYFQAYPMSTRLQEDLESNLDGVAWGFRIKINDMDNRLVATGYSAYIDLDLHPKFPFTYH